MKRVISIVEDEKDINNVVKVLQDKMTKYVNENK